MPVDSPVRVLDLVAEAGVTGSKGEARRLIQAGGLRINNLRVEDTDAEIGPDDFIAGEMLLIRKGKKKYHIVHRTPKGGPR